MRPSQQLPGFLLKVSVTRISPCTSTAAVGLLVCATWHDILFVAQEIEHNATQHTALCLYDRQRWKETKQLQPVATPSQE